MAIERTGKAKEHFDRAQQLYEQAEKEADFEKVIAEYSEVIKLLPNDDYSYKERGSIYNIVGPLEKALDDFNKAISLNPEYGFHYSNRAVLYLRFGDNEKAVADIEKAVEVAPKGAGYFYMTFGSGINKYTGDKREAAKYFKKSIEHGDFEGKAKKELAKLGI